MTATNARFGLNLISAVSAQGALRFAVLTGTLTAAAFIAFCRRLLHDAASPRRRAGVPHRRQPSGAPLQGGGRVRRLHRRCAAALPAYSPQLNPDEWVWNNVKHNGVTPAAPKGPEQMKSIVTARLRRLQQLPHIIRGFFVDPALAYITAATRSQ